MLNRYGNLLLAALTLPIIILGLASTLAACDAARAAREQVLAQTIPVVDVGPKGLRRFAYPDGHIVQPGVGAIDIDIANGRIYMAVNVLNRGAGFAIVHTWRTSTAAGLKKIPYHEPDVDAPSRQSFIAAGQGANLYQGFVLDSPIAEALANAIRSGRRLVFEFYFTDISEHRKYKSTWLVAQRPHTGLWYVDQPSFQHGWGPTSGLEPK